MVGKNNFLFFAITEDLKCCVQIVLKCFHLSLVVYFIKTKLSNCNFTLSLNEVFRACNFQVDTWLTPRNTCVLLVARATSISRTCIATNATSVAKSLSFRVHTARTRANTSKAYKRIWLSNTCSYPWQYRYTSVQL